jgi:formylglycine-generating enzyme required for sulfatase activity
VPSPRPNSARAAVLVAFFLSWVAGPGHVPAAEPPAEPEFRRFFVHYADRRSMTERALNLVGLNANEVGRSFALVAGVSRYEFLPELRAAAVDVEKMTHYLIDQQFFDEVVVLADDDFTEQNLRYFLQSYFPERVLKFPKSRFLFAFSGHGINDGPQGYLLLSTAHSLEDKYRSINLSVVRTMLQEVVRKGYQVLALINSCYGGNFVTPGFGGGRYLPTRPGAHALTAGAANELVYADPAVGPGSVFFETVLAALDERADTFPPAQPGDPNSMPGDGVITWDELSTYVRLSIRQYTHDQVNPLEGDLNPITRKSLGGFFFLNQRRQMEARRTVPEPSDRGTPSGGAPVAEPPVSVVEVQRLLAARGYDPGPVDGILGGATRAAIGRFQRDYGLAATGEPSTELVANLGAPPPRPQPAVGVYPGQTFKDCDVCPEMVVVPAGSFMMGSPPDEKDRDDDEGPQHRVTIAGRFAVGKYEITRGEYTHFVQRSGPGGGLGCSVRTDGKWNEDAAKGWQDPGFIQTNDHPAVCVSWHDAKAYVEWLRSKTGKDYRLLTEAEWEYVARAGTSTRYWWGREISQHKGNCAGCGSPWDDKQTAPVGSFASNAFDVHDVHGNVWEWVSDCYHRDAYETHDDYPAMVGSWQDSCNRVLRGGSWHDKPRYLRAANRTKYDASARLATYGFRVARTLSPSDP